MQWGKVFGYERTSSNKKGLAREGGQTDASGAEGRKPTELWPSMPGRGRKNNGLARLVLNLDTKIGSTRFLGLPQVR